jgi:hypothetical protein
MSAISTTKTDRLLEDKMLAHAGDPERVDVLGKARAFKRSWLELAEALTRVLDKGSWESWGYKSFDAYCKKELHITPSTAAKLTGSFRFLKTSAPTVLERSRQEDDAVVPDIKAVDFVARAAERGAADEETMREIRRVAFDEGANAPMLARRFKSVAFPVSEAEKESKALGQLDSGARRLLDLIAVPDLPIEHDVLVQVEEALGRLRQAIESKLA